MGTVGRFLQGKRGRYRRLRRRYRLGQDHYTFLICRNYDIQRGEILIDGTDMTKKSQKEKDKFRIKNIGYIFQDFKLIPEMTVIDNINILRLERVDTSRADEILSKLGMLEKKNKKIKHLSGGEKQRVAIARAIVKLPDIILADEPTGNLNFEIGEAVIRELIEISKGKTLIAVTHDERLGKYFDFTVDMNEMVGGERNA